MRRSGAGRRRAAADIAAVDVEEAHDNRAFVRECVLACGPRRLRLARARQEIRLDEWAVARAHTVVDRRRRRSCHRSAADGRADGEGAQSFRGRRLERRRTVDGGHAAACGGQLRHNDGATALQCRGGAVACRRYGCDAKGGVTGFYD